MKKLLFLFLLLFSIDSHATLAVTIKAHPGDTVCAGTLVTFTATITGCSVINYAWSINGLFVGSDTTFTEIANPSHSVRCHIYGIDSASGDTVNVSSNIIVITIAPPITPTISLWGSTSVPIGTTVTINATVVDAGPNYNIRWIKNGALFATSVVPVEIYTKALGIDTITATVVSTSNGCHDSAASTMHFISTTVSVNSINAQPPYLNIYPSPTTGVFTIQTPINISLVSVYNIAGIRVYERTSTATEMELDITSLPSGVYMVYVQCGDKQYVSKVIKQGSVSD